MFSISKAADPNSHYNEVNCTQPSPTVRLP